MNTFKYPLLVVGIVIAIVIAVVAWDYTNKQEAAKTTEVARKICLSLPHSTIPGNEIKNYVACMVDHGQMPNDTDVRALK